MMNEKNVWYAYQETEEERQDAIIDHEGTTDSEEAFQWLRDQLKAGNEDAQVEVCECDENWLHVLTLDVLYTDDVTI